LMYDQSSFSPLPTNSNTAQGITPTCRSRYTGKSTLYASIGLAVPPSCSSWHRNCTHVHPQTIIGK
jgi:hypothetical protein